MIFLLIFYSHVGGSLDNIKNDWSEREMSEEEAQYRNKWRRLIKIRPSIKVRKDAEEEDSHYHLFSFFYLIFLFYIIYPF